MKCGFLIEFATLPFSYGTLTIFMSLPTDLKLLKDFHILRFQNYGMMNQPASILRVKKLFVHLSNLPSLLLLSSNIFVCKPPLPPPPSPLPLPLPYTSRDYKC
jgi:hypothetical protein